MSVHQGMYRSILCADTDDGGIKDDLENTYKLSLYVRLYIRSGIS